MTALHIAIGLQRLFAALVVALPHAPVFADDPNKLIEWTSSAGTKTDGVFYKYDSEEDAVVLLIPKRIPLSKLSADSRKMALRLHDESQAQQAKSTPKPSKAKVESQPIANEKAAPERVSEAGKWYEGGTLHDKSILDWQVAKEHDKIATCSDFIAKMWQDDKLNSRVARKIGEIDDLKPLAVELVAFIDAASAPQADAESNRRSFTNQTVSSFAVIGMIQMGWLE